MQAASVIPIDNGKLHRQTDRQTDRKIDRHSYTDRQTQADRQIDTPSNEMPTMTRVRAPSFDSRAMMATWIDQWMDGGMDGWMDGWIDGWMDGPNGWIDSRMDGWPEWTGMDGSRGQRMDWRWLA